MPRDAPRELSQRQPAEVAAHHDGEDKSSEVAPTQANMMAADPSIRNVRTGSRTMASTPGNHAAMQNHPLAPA